MAYTYKICSGLSQFIRKMASLYCFLFVLYVLFVISRLEIQKTDSEAFANVGFGFCDQSDTSNCVVYVDLLKDAILPLPICHLNGSFEWPKSMSILLQSNNEQYLEMFRLQN